MENDHQAEQLQFDLPLLSPDQRAYLCVALPDGQADVVSIENGICSIPRELTAQSGEIKAWVEIQADEQAVWHSRPLHLFVDELPPISDLVEKSYPTALEEAIRLTAQSALEAAQARDEALGVSSGAAVPTIASASSGDLEIADESGNVLLRLERGHIKTQKFDSSDIPSGGQADLSHVQSIGTGVGDLDVTDENGNVLARLEDGHIKTQKFDSESVKEPLEHYQSAVKSFVRGSVNTLTVSHSFRKGERILFHVEDDAVNWEYGHYADYYEGSNLLIAGRRGSQGYFEHVISQNCQEVSVKLAWNEYADGTDVRLHVYVVNGEVKPTIITVGADGKRMFTTLKAAVESIHDASSAVNPYVIEVYPGEYNTLAGYTEEQIQSADTSGGGYTQDTFVGLKLTDGISIRGVGGTREKIILKAELSTTDYSSGVRGNISTLNIQGSGFIENMTIIGKNLRYCVHDDFVDPTNTHGWRRLKDLKFIGANLAYAPYFTTYGAGMSMPRDYYIENCDFGFDLGIHSNGRYSFGCRIEAVHCTGHRFRIGDYAGAESEVPFEVYVNDCNFDIIRVNRANASLSSHVRLMGTGGEHSLIKTKDDEIYQLGMIDKTVANFQKGTLLSRVSGGASFAATQNIGLAAGVVIAADSNYSYIQREGYVASNMVGLTGLSLGDSVTVDSNNKLTSGGSAGSRVGIVKAVDADGIAYIHLWH